MHFSCVPLFSLPLSEPYSLQGAGS
jgi:hypothetical protein